MLPTTAPATVPPEGLLPPSPEELPPLASPDPDEDVVAEPGAVHCGESVDALSAEPVAGEFGEPVSGAAESGEDDDESTGDEGFVEEAVEDEAAGEAAVGPEALGLGATLTNEG